MLKNKKGITLVALVITIVILLILAAISIASLTESRMFAQTQLSKEKNRYVAAKETIILKLMEILIEKQNVYTIADIAEVMKKADNITIEKYFNSEVALIKPGVTEQLTDLKAIAISVNEQSEYKFLIGKECKIAGVLEGEILDITQENAFKKVEQFEKDQFNILAGSSSGTQTPDPNPGPELPVPVEVTLASRVNVGDYVKYTPDIVTITDSEETTDEKYTQLLSDLSQYSGNTSASYNTSSTITQETNLNWRVLDKVKDENGNDCVRLISEAPTTSKIRLYSYNGYNNAVYLIDKACNTLYNNLTYAKKIQNLKIEDIVEYMETKPIIEDITITPSNFKYPSILEQEKNQTVTIGENIISGTLDLSEQTEPIKQTETKTATSLSLKHTNWSQTMTEESFTDAKYYNLFMKDNNGNDYPTYWLSSRYVVALSDSYFAVRRVISGKVWGYDTYRTSGKSYGETYALRPVITLNADVMIDEEKSGDGTEVAKQYILK